MEDKGTGEGKPLTFTMGVRPEDEGTSPGGEEKPQDDVAILTNLVNGLANQVAALIQKVSGHDQMIAFGQQVLRQQGIQFAPMGTAAAEPGAGTTEETGTTEEAAGQGVPSQLPPMWLLALNAINEFLKQAQGFAGSIGSPEQSGQPGQSGQPDGQTDPFDAVGALVTKVFEIEDKISTRAAKAHEANLKALGPVIREVVQNVLAGKALPPALPPEGE